MASSYVVPAACAVIAGALVVGVAIFRKPRRIAKARQDSGPDRSPPAEDAQDSADESGSGQPRRSREPRAAVPEPEPEALQQSRFEALRALQVIALGTAIQPPSGVHDEIAMQVRLTLASITDKPNYAPRRPLLLPKLVQAMNDDDVSRRELSQIIGGDPGLAANLLQLANSPFYRINPEPVESLDRAVAVLGLEGMRRLIAAALLQPVFRISGGTFERFGEVMWEHTQAAGRAAEAHAAILENSDPFAAQLLSLMAGLAGIIVFRVTVDEYLARGLPPHAGAIAALLDSQTALVARQIAASWSLSDRIDRALAEQTPGSASPPASPLGRSLLFGRFLGALAVLRTRKVLDEEAVLATLAQAGALQDPYQRIWGRLNTTRS